jgi:hypothetical protein
MQGVSTKELIRVRRLAKRQRAAVACANCRLSKTKCTDYRPCKKCARLNVKCVNDKVNGSDFLHQISKFCSKTNNKNSNLTENAAQNCRNMINSSRAVTYDYGLPYESWIDCEATAEHIEPTRFPPLKQDGPLMMEYQATPEPVNISQPNFESILSDVILFPTQASTKNDLTVHAPLVRPSALRLLPAMNCPPSSSAAFPRVALAFPSKWGPFVSFQTMHSPMLFPNPRPPSLPEMCNLPTLRTYFPPGVAAIPAWGLAPCPTAIHYHVPDPFLPLAAQAMRQP